jgi:hypothetical protein
MQRSSSVFVLGINLSAGFEQTLHRFDLLMSEKRSTWMNWWRQSLSRSTCAGPMSWRPCRPKSFRITGADLVNRIREKGHVLSADGLLTIKLAKEFGFCYGVERAIDLAYAARRVFPPPKSIYLLGEIIHNPEVNDQIRNMGIQIISPKPTEEELAGCTRGTWSSSRLSARKWKPNRSWSPKDANWSIPPAAT